MHLGIDLIVIDIASIMICQRSFFVAEEKRENIETFMHNLVDYDNGLCNDFYLQQVIFDEWRIEFFAKSSKKPNSSYEDE